MTDNPYAPPRSGLDPSGEDQALAENNGRHAKGRRVCLVLICLAFTAGQILRPIDPASEFVAGFATAILAALWCKLDAKDRRVTLPPWNVVLIVLLVFVGLPTYFFRTMSFRAAALRSLKAGGFFLLILVLAAVCSEIVSTFTNRPSGQ